MTAAAAGELSRTMAQILPAIRGLESLKTVHRIFDDLGNGKIDVVKAAFELAKLGVAMPEPIKILLSKHKADELPPDDGEVITDEMIMQRRAEIMRQIETERAVFVPARKEEVIELKKELSGSDSFKIQQDLEGTGHLWSHLP